jgi:hypothetical protein
MTISGAEVPAIPDVLIEDADLRNILIALKTIAEIREGRHQDTNQRFITYYELVDYLRGQDQLVVEASTTGHNHNDLYATLVHDHDDVYSLLTHDHNKLYSLIIHNHNDLYSIIGHNHDDLYSLIGHDHNELYALAIHDHGDIYSLSIHDHDSLYAALNHDHNGRYAELLHGHGDLARAINEHEHQDVTDALQAENYFLATM